MAERPVFVPCGGTLGLVTEVSLRFVWHPGFARVQKHKNVKALHAAAAGAGYSPVLEVSTKSEEKLGRHLSAFHLRVPTKDLGAIPLECAFQGSKVFQRGGPFIDLYTADARSARRDPRLRGSGSLVAFRFEGIDFPLEPKTAFYDWLYLNAIFPHREWLDRLKGYAGFSDIEFNPQRSINCQARSCALFVSLRAKRLLEDALSSPADFIELTTQHRYPPSRAVGDMQETLFPRLP